MKHRQSLLLLLSLFVLYLAAPQTACVAAEGLDEKRAAKEIDEFVLAHLKSKNLKPNPAITDDQFVRRTYLAIIGRIPTTAESAVLSLIHI